MPNNADGSSNSTDGREYLELYNTTTSAVDLTGWTISDGFTYTFPAASIAAGGYLVLAKDSVAYYAKYESYPDLDWGGDGNGALNNSGEDVSISDANGTVVDGVTYDDGWASSTDGDGPSLERVHPNTNGSVSTSWAAYTGTDSAGTPGARNSTYRDLMLEGFESGASGWQVLSNPTGANSAYNVAGIYSSSYYAHSGSKSFRFTSYYSGDNTQYLISPELSVQAGDSVSFWYRSYIGTETFEVGVSTTDSLPASFTFGSSNSGTSTYARHAEDLSSYAGQNVFLAIKYTTNYNYYLFIDDITGPAHIYPSTPVESLSAASLALGSTTLGSSSSSTLSLSK